MKNATSMNESSKIQAEVTDLSATSSASTIPLPTKVKNHKAALPPLFWYMEMGDWEKATDRAQRHPRDVRNWATLRTKSMADAKVSGTKRLALHHACFKLRSVIPNSRTSSTQEDSFVEVCKFIMLLISIYPEAASKRESRHGCLPLHLAAFASCAPRYKDDVISPPVSPMKISSNHMISRPHSLSHRIPSEGTTASSFTNMTEMYMDDLFMGNQTAWRESPGRSDAASSTAMQPNIVVSMDSNVVISAKREDMAVKVINALLDAYPKAIKVDSEGGRLPLHTACAGRATPRVISTLVTAYPAAARHRNKDGFLPLHLAAHWGVSHPNVAVVLLKAYPDSTLGRNRWERTPLEEALCMAGENGRPHQAALVRALRKHPSYWTKIPEELISSDFGLSRADGPTTVDIDETLPDDETSQQDYGRQMYGEGLEFLNDENDHNAFSPIRESPLKSNKFKEMSLASLIRNQNWSAVMTRISQEAGEEIQALTKGGFLATEGFTPLHYACERRPPLEVVEALITTWPESVTTRLQPGGALPLHIACTWQASVEVVEAICLAEPAACRIPDDLGNIPLHCAVFSGTAIGVVEVLLRTFPKSVTARNLQGSLPIDIIKRLRHINRRSAMELVNATLRSLSTTTISRSNGSQGSVALRATEMKNRDGADIITHNGQQLLTDGDEGVDIDLDAGVEVTYDPDDREDLVWI